MTVRVAADGGEHTAEERRLDAFAATAAHSVGAGVSVASGYATLLRERFSEPLGPEGMRALAGLDGGLARLRVFMDDLLELAALDHRPFEPAPVDLARIATSAVSGLAGPLEEAGVEVDVGPLPAIVADGAMLERLLHHLVRGALAAIPSGPGHVAISGVLCSGDVLIEVTDSGPPLDPVAAAELFDAFAPPRGHGPAVGAAVGMTIARRIAERHGGSIRARPGAAGGCAVAVEFPAGPA